MCSPKTGEIISALRGPYLFNVYWKYIVRMCEPVAENDGLPMLSTQIPGQIKRLFRPLRLNDPEIRSRIFVQACDDRDQAANVEYAKSIALRYNYRLSIQTHKLLGLD